MYGNIVILITSFIMLVVSVPLFAMIWVGEDKYKNSLKDYSYYLFSIIDNGEKITKQEDKDDYDAWYKTIPISAKIYSKLDGVITIILFCLAVISGIAFFANSIIAVTNCITIPSDIIKYKEMYALYQELLENNSGFDITSDMVNMKMELNNWLLNAKIALERWGFWSSYYPYAEEILQLSYLM